jgi:Na+-transporting NADH:ubiquinone oxidoreductase subunit NqrC
MAINKNSNAYIIIYTVVMVVIVGALLAFLATSLKDKQAANVLNEKKVSIMKAFGSAEENFDDVVTMGRIVDGAFVEVKRGKGISVVGENGKYVLTADRITDFCRALTHLKRKISGGEDVVEQCRANTLCLM